MASRPIRTAASSSSAQGSDTRAYRLDGGRWFELDDVQLLEFKASRPPAADAKNRLERIPVAFDTTTADRFLTPLAGDDEAVVILEGVSMYLSDDTLTALARALVRHLPNATLVCDLMSPMFARTFSRGLRQALAGIGATFGERHVHPRVALERGGLSPAHAHLDPGAHGRTRRTALPTLAPGDGVQRFARRLPGLDVQARVARVPALRGVDPRHPSVGAPVSECPDMGKLYDAITPEHETFIAKQPLYFVASAPLAAGGHVNLSPKGLDSFRVVDASTVMYLDLTGSGNETAAHIVENSRLTIMFCAFSGHPKILRLYCRGRVVTRTSATGCVPRPLPRTSASVRSSWETSNRCRPRAASACQS
ncbi:MAG: class I SAM-dependent methyltransferase [Vicinamibacterales bacterium]